MRDAHAGSGCRLRTGAAKEKRDGNDTCLEHRELSKDEEDGRINRVPPESRAIDRESAGQ
jgi:hypothetical protein